MELLSPEYYQLKCCQSGKVLEVNGLPAKFMYTGLFNNDNTPDSMVNKVLTKIIDQSGNVIVGCYQLQDADCFEEWEEFKFENIFDVIYCVNTCEECLSINTPTTNVTNHNLLNHKLIFPEFKVNNVNAEEAEEILCRFGTIQYQKVLSHKYGVSFCCTDDLMQSQIDYEILKMDMSEDVNACANLTYSGTCKQYDITIPSNVEGILYFKDCNSEIRTVQFVKANQSYSVSVCGIKDQTVTDIYILADHSTIINVNFTETAILCE